MLSDRTLTRSVLAAVVLTVSASTAGAPPSSGPRVERPEPARPPAQVVRRPEPGCRETRENLEELLKKLPPAVGRVLRTRPVAALEQAYLAPYPALAAFLKQHPEVVQHPRVLLRAHRTDGVLQPAEPETRESQAIRIWRRPDAVSRGWRHLRDWSPGPSSGSSGRSLNNGGGTARLRCRPRCTPSCWIASPRTRICWPTCRPRLADGSWSRRRCRSTRPRGRSARRSAASSGPCRSASCSPPAASGCSLSAPGHRGMAQPLFVIGVLALALGAGFVVSAGASFLLSRRLGLLRPPAPPREHTKARGTSPRDHATT